MPKFVNREKALDDLDRLTRVASSTRRVVLLDSPAGMGKTQLLTKVCLELIEHAYRQQTMWKIARIDFRDHYPRPCNNREDIIEEIARQLCRDTNWNNIRTLVQQAEPDDQVLIQQATFIPMKDEARQALLRIIRNVSRQDLKEIRGLLVKAFDIVDVQELRRTRGAAHQPLNVADLVGFILEKKNNPDQCFIPDHVLLVLDGLDAISDEQLRDWVINRLALGLGLHDGLQGAFRRFVVILSGRFIGRGLDPETEKRYFREIVLQSFENYIADIEDLIHQFGDTQFNRQDIHVSRLARKLAQVCGGHPKVIKEMASELHSRPGHFSALDMDPQRPEYWYDDLVLRASLTSHRKHAIEEIVEGTSNQQRRLLELLSVFRKFNRATLELLSSKTQGCGASSQDLYQYRGCLEGDVDELYDSLLETRLIWEGGLEPFCSDRFALSLMTAQLQEEKPDLFCLLNKWAVKIFEDWVKGKFPDDPDTLRPQTGDYQRICVCEWLFHRLHLSEHCTTMPAAHEVGQKISQELDKVLEAIQPFPGEHVARQRQRIRKSVEQDQQINHLIWETALEDPGRYSAIHAQILATF